MVTLSDFVNYFAPLSHGERTPVTRDQVWSGLRGHRRLARAARKQLVERQIAEDAQVKQDESLTHNISDSPVDLVPPDFVLTGILDAPPLFLGLCPWRPEIRGY
jgi:hypothetical protein